MNINKTENIDNKMNPITIKKQNTDTSCIAACIQSIIATLNDKNDLPSQQEIREKSATLTKTEKTGFEFLETAATYLSNYFTEHKLNFKVYTYIQNEVLSQHANDFSGVTYVRNTGTQLDDTNPELLNKAKKEAISSAKKSGAKIIYSGISFNHIKEELTKGSYIILGINTQPIQEYFNTGHPGFGHAIIPINIGETAKIGDPLPEIPDILDLPINILKEAMHSQGTYFKNGLTEAIVIKKAN